MERRNFNNGQSIRGGYNNNGGSSRPFTQQNGNSDGYQRRDNGARGDGQRYGKENSYGGGFNKDRSEGGGYNKERGETGYNKDRQGGQGYQGKRDFGGNPGGEAYKKQRFDTNQSTMSGSSGFSSFAKKPGSSSVVALCNPEEGKVQKLNFFTNQFRMKIGQNAPQIYQYPINLFHGDETNEMADDSSYKFTPLEVGKVVDRERNRIEMLVGKHIYSGFNIWTMQQLDQSYLIQSKLMGQKVTLKIDLEGEHIVNTSDIENPNRQDCQAMSQVLNVIVKQAMSETGLLQFGQRPRFFDSSCPIDVAELQMQIWKGFKCTAYKYQSGCSLIIDSCNRFMSTKSVLDSIHEIYDEIIDQEFQGNVTADGLAKFKDTVRKMFIGQSVIANYGTKRTYIVQDIQFEHGPANTYFNVKDGEKISVARYFYKTYNMRITDKRQPMLIMNTQGRQVSLPSEFCLVDGVPDSIRNNSKAMRTLLNSVKQNPQEKLDAITGMVNKLFKMSKWGEWDIQIEAKPQILESRKLAAPELVHNEGADKHLYANERLLKQMPVFSSEAMGTHELFIVYDRYSKSEAEMAQQNLMKCQGQLGMQSNRFRTLALPDWRGNFAKVEQALKDFLHDERCEKPMFAVMILDKRHDYPKIKNIFTRKNIMSQVILKMTAKKMNLSVASNIMKQINSKLGGDSVRMKFPAFMKKERVMVIGIDVCHAGKKSVVGFCASTNSTCTQYYSDIIIQPKFQEIVKKDLDRCLINAIQSFSKENQGNLPTKIIIYRDGVGEGMRDQIIEKEVKQFKEVLKPLYNQLTGIPPITLVVVNKRINQRMFIQSRDGRTVENPPPGSIIDSTLVENQQDNTCFDFFLVPQQTTQGCVTPTHFYVSLNESQDISKECLENMTYAFCYMYSNWSGSIKVPAPCQYAHKIAEYHYSFDSFGLIKKQQKVDLKQLCYNEDFLNNFYYL